MKAVVAVRPGKYVEGVVLDGTQRKKSFDDLTIKGTKKDRKKVVLEGKNAKGELGRRAERDRGDQRRRARAGKHVGPQLPVERVLHPRLERRRPALRRLHDGQPTGLG